MPPREQNCYKSQLEGMFKSS